MRLNLRFIESPYHLHDHTSLQSSFRAKGTAIKAAISSAEQFKRIRDPFILFLSEKTAVRITECGIDKGVQQFMKLLKTALAGASLSLLFAGCSTAPVAVTEENAPSEILKHAVAINGESTMTEMTNVFQEMVDQTYASCDGGLILKETATGNGLDVSGETVTTSNMAYKTMDVRVGTSDTLYQVYEYQVEDQEKEEAPADSSASSSEAGSDEAVNSATENQGVYGLMKTNVSSQTTVYTTLDPSASVGNATAPMTIDTIYTNESASEVDDVAGAIQNSVVYPLYSLFGSNLLLTPYAYPDLYDYKVEKIGTDYVWTISIADIEEYTKTLDEQYESMYGVSRLDLKGDGTMVLDAYDIEKIDLKITTDKDGAIRSIENDNKSRAVMGEEEMNLVSNDKVTVTKAGDTWKTFFEGFFYNVEKGTLKEGDTFKLTQTFKDMPPVSEEASSEASKADSKNESEAVKDSAKESKSSEKASTDAKADSKEDKKDASSTASKPDADKDKAADKKDSAADSKKESKADAKDASSEKTSAKK